MTAEPTTPEARASFTRPGTVTVGPMRTPADAEAFRRIGEEWLTRLFSVTDADADLLGDPRGRIVERGGAVLIAHADGEPVGCVALLPYPDRVFELSKMGVSPGFQGGGIGRRLVTAAVDEARRLGARRVFLGSSHVLGPALHLYEEAGFIRITRADLPVDDYYARADVFMDLPL
ncbi:GNAT family N-acetyltransferase [Tsukamurella soli]|uniref:N-acetyltransferase domain-containing protein n=1 Tax=Tsukamurella soli TaxID=644556 RepID=A0ABP8J4K5_9ACTN